MDYLTAKETRVEKAWQKRGIAGLRSELLARVDEYLALELDDVQFVKNIAWTVYMYLPEREFAMGRRLVLETCALAGIDVQGQIFISVIEDARVAEQDMREEIGDE